MLFSKKLKEMTAAFVDRCCRYGELGSGQPRLDDAQRHWIEVWGVSGGKE